LFLPALIGETFAALSSGDKKLFRNKKARAQLYDHFNKRFSPSFGENWYFS
jgi:hypothetical protein